MGLKMTDGKITCDKEEEISCSGCGGWELIEKLVNEDNPQWNYIDENGNLTFGKHKGESLEDVSKNDKEYIDWAYSSVGGFRYRVIERKCRCCGKQNNVIF